MSGLRSLSTIMPRSGRHGARTELRPHREQSRLCSLVLATDLGATGAAAPQRLNSRDALSNLSYEQACGTGRTTPAYITISRSATFRGLPSRRADWTAAGSGRGHAMSRGICDCVMANVMGGGPGCIWYFDIIPSPIRILLIRPYSRGPPSIALHAYGGPWCPPIPCLCNRTH
jgi:hypothetical protein